MAVGMAVTNAAKARDVIITVVMGNEIQAIPVKDDQNQGPVIILRIDKGELTRKDNSKRSKKKGQNRLLKKQNEAR